MRIFIFDWSGTLNHLPDVKGYLTDLRVRNPGCYIVCNSGHAWYDIADQLGLSQLQPYFDMHCRKNTVREIFYGTTRHPDSYWSIENPIAAKDVSEVLIVDDEDYNSWAYENLSETWGIPFRLFNGHNPVEKMEEALK